ncbi:hypothetical protein [Hoeflea sp.]|uniref:hypothetical protein n=1 Tax=Hoeflea sp. TaxID=1940281 RepID=UPI003B51C2A2
MPTEDVAGMGHNNPPLPELLKQEFMALMDEVESLAADANSAKRIADETGLSTDEDVLPLIEIGTTATKLAPKIDRMRLERTLPLRNDVETINGFFNVMKTRVERIKKGFAAKVGEYDAAKRAREKREAAEATRLAQEEAQRKLDEASTAQHSVMGDVLMNEAAEAEYRANRAALEATRAGTGPTKTDAGTVSQSAPWTFTVENWDEIDLRELRDSFTVAEIEKAIRGHVRKHKNTKPLKGVRFYQEAKTSFR